VGGDHMAQHGVTQELEPLEIAVGAIGHAAVGKGLLQQEWIPEAVPQPPFELTGFTLRMPLNNIK